MERANRWMVRGEDQYASWRIRLAGCLMVGIEESLRKGYAVPHGGSHGIERGRVDRVEGKEGLCISRLFAYLIPNYEVMKDGWVGVSPAQPSPVQHLLNSKKPPVDWKEGNKHVRISMCCVV